MTTCNHEHLKDTHDCFKNTPTFKTHKLMINDPKDLDQERIMYHKLKQSFVGDRSDSTTYMTVASSTSISQP